MKRLALICALIAVSALGDGMPRARDGRGRWGRAGVIASGASCLPSIQGGPVVASDWTTDHAGAAAPTVTQNFAPGPPGSCGLSTRLQIPATATSQYSILETLTPPSGSSTSMCAGTSSNISFGYWLRATTSQTIDVCTQDNAHATQCYTCATMANTWVFCALDNKTFWLASNAFWIGNDAADNGGTARSAIDLQVYAPRCVVGSSISQ